MPCEFIADAAATLVANMQRLGVSAQVAGMVAAEWSAEIERNWGGERPYIGTSSTATRERSKRDAAIIRAHRNGERVQLLAKRHGISARMVQKIISLSQGRHAQAPHVP